MRVVGARIPVAMWSSAFIALAASCGGGGDGGTAPPIEEPPAAGSCTGTVPEHALACPGSTVGLTADAPRVVRTSCANTPCAYTCAEGYALENGACAAIVPPATAEFVDNGDGTVSVTNALGTLVWLRDANCLETAGGVVRGDGPILWPQALAWSVGLASGMCGLSDGSAAGDWALPIVTELTHLSLDLTTGGTDAWGHFSEIQSLAYWTDYSVCVGFQGAVVISTGVYEDMREGARYGVWPVKRTH